MNTALECMPCFMKMALQEAKLAAPDDETAQKDVVVAWGRKMGELDWTQSPPALARHLARLVRSMTGCGDLYREDKSSANERMLQAFPALREKLLAERKHGDSLALALELAIIGNFMDRGVDLTVDMDEELAAVSDTIDQGVLQDFKSRAVEGADILVLGDNTGEIVLDKLLVEELQHRGCHVTYAVRSHPIINDATMEDAQYVGMTELCPVMESGVDTPGTVIEYCQPDFLAKLHTADCILSKGQGNFEALEGVMGGVYCAFKVKCKRVSEETGLAFGASSFWKTSPKT